MNERERLIELLKSVPPTRMKFVGRMVGKTYTTLSGVADHLLANGVIVPPCKVGDCIYLPWQYDGVSGIAGLYVTYMVIDQDEFRIMTDFSTDDEGFFDLYNGGKFNPSDFGKTVFLTKEEAEKALAERSENK